MNQSRFPILFSALAVAASLLVSCGGSKEEAHHSEGEKAEGKDDGHGHEEETPSGAEFKAGTGVIVADETRKILGIEIVDVTEAKLPEEHRFSVQIFGEKHRPDLSSEDHYGCDVLGSGLVSSNTAASIKPGQPVQLLKGTNTVAGGVVLAIQKALALGESEIVVGVSNAVTVVKPGEFISGSISLPRDEAVTVIPRSAVLRTSEGTFVYAVNGDAYLRTSVKVGSQTAAFSEITDGLLAGDQVVTKPVETLWIIELRATKGGGHSH